MDIPTTDPRYVPRYALFALRVGQNVQLPTWEYVGVATQARYTTIAASAVTRGLVSYLAAVPMGNDVHSDPRFGTQVFFLKDGGAAWIFPFRSAGVSGLGEADFSRPIAIFESVPGLGWGYLGSLFEPYADAAIGEVLGKLTGQGEGSPGTLAVVYPDGTEALLQRSGTEAVSV